jgi:hypothetical protein
LLTSRAFDRAEAIFPAVIERLSEQQRLMLYCGRDLVAKLEGQSGLKVDIQKIPQSQARLIAIFSRE